MTPKIDYKRISRRRLIGAGAVAGLFAAGSLSAGAAPRAGGSLRLAVPGPITPFDPADRFSPAMCVAGVGGAFDCLTEIAADGALVGELAESWEVSADARLWTFRLRKGVVFHDGRPLTAEDVVQSLKRHMSPRHASPAAQLVSHIASVRRSAPLTVQISLEIADPALPFLLADPHLIVLPASDVRNGSASRTGTGLYRIEEMDADRILLRRQHGHFRDGRAGWFERVEVLAIDDPGARAEALLIGRVDAVSDPDTAILRQVQRRGRIEQMAMGRARVAADVAAEDDEVLAQVEDALASLANGRRDPERHLPFGLEIAASPEVPASVISDVRRLSGDSAPTVRARIGLSLRRSRPTESWELAELKAQRSPQVFANNLPARAHLELPGPRSTIAHSTRLGRGLEAGAYWPMDDSRIAERWWRS